MLDDRRWMMVVGRRRVAEVAGREGGGVAGGEPGYRETSRMLAESGLSLAFDELPDVAGQLTTAQAMGPALRQRLVDSGMTFRVLEAAKRPVAAVADHAEFRKVARVEVEMDHAVGLTLLHDPGHSMEERILREQFGA